MENIKIGSEVRLMPNTVFLNNNKEKKKEILYSLVQLFERANLDNESMKLLENMIIDNYKKTTN